MQVGCVRAFAAAISLCALSCASTEKLSGAPIGEPCTDGSECISGICIFVDDGGVCTGACEDGCPDGWGCFGVRDVIEPGTVSEVCVPEAPNLCTRCETDSDCSVTGEDLCLTDELGKSFCGRSCESVSCPEGFSCEEKVSGTRRSMQCVPLSGSCDCGDAEANSTEDCALETFNGECPGVRTCQGGIGWSDCQPLTDIDTPDAMFADENCDGLDGTLDHAILVATDGVDEPSCGLGPDDPCESINFAIELAAAAGRGYVLVQQGLYIEAVRLADGVSVFGGYDRSWRRGPHTESAHRVEILGTADSETGEYVSVFAIDITGPTTLGDLHITGATAKGQVTNSGRASYAIYARNAVGLEIERIDIIAGDGADGATGTRGADAPTVSRTSAMNGGNGGRSREFSTICNDSSRGASGTRGDNTCGSGRDPDGGRGGFGGTMDTDCPFSLTATGGEGGRSADLTIGSFGLGGFGGSGGGTCGSVGNGSRGFVSNGSAGAGASAGGFLSGNFWRTRSGGSGGLGRHGTGGGGGGGSGGCDVNIDSYGAGGGGGAAGGCRARGGGRGGNGGGGSFGIFAVSSEISVIDCALVRGNGGDGGRGGAGGRGQSGGLGGDGGTSTNDSRPGGDGGDGAHGGHGGGGGGGAGGPSAAIASRDSTVTHDCSVSGGSGGSGGAGGASAPSAPVSERDGRSGRPGDPGALAGELVIP